MCIPINPEWTERIYVSIYNVRDKNTILGFGVGQYPNKNVQDGFATVWHEGKQYNFRASRTLRPRIDEVKIGPLSVETLEGLRRFRIKLDDNPSTLATRHRMDRRDESARGGARSARERRQGGAGHLALRPGRARARHPTIWRKNHLARPMMHGGRIAIAHGARAARCAPTPPTAKRTTFAPFLFSWSVAQFPGYALHWRFVERAAGKYSYFSGERVKPFGESE